ncbi:MAG: recombinase family protein [Acidimicrobiia bacterium]|nr:recombinase family protein [Acidimicrobiia bacterium]
MRVVAYVREAADPAGDRPAFAQQEEIRRFAAAHGLQVVALCQDVRSPGRALGREGYLSLLGVLASGNAEAVLVPGLDTLSSDLVVQEIMLWDLRARGAAVLSTEPADVDALAAGPSDPTRQFVRHVLARVVEHGALAAARPAGMAPPSPPADDGVVVSLLSPTEPPPATETD